MWSVSTEWQIYFVFPLLLLPVWRRFGIGASVMIAISLGTGIHFLRGQTDVGALWYVGLFGLGMLGAVVCWPRTTMERRLQSQINWCKMAMFLLGLTMLGIIGKPGWCERHWWLVDLFVGAATMCMVICCARQRQAGNVDLLLLRVLES